MNVAGITHKPVWTEWYSTLVVAHVLGLHGKTEPPHTALHSVHCTLLTICLIVTFLTSTQWCAMWTFALAEEPTLIPRHTTCNFPSPQGRAHARWRHGLNLRPWPPAYFTASISSLFATRPCQSQTHIHTPQGPDQHVTNRSALCPSLLVTRRGAKAAHSP